MKFKRNSVYGIAQVALFVALMTASAYIQIPFPLVPLTFQTVIAVLSGLLLGAKKGAAAMSVFGSGRVARLFRRWRIYIRFKAVFRVHNRLYFRLRLIGCARKEIVFGQTRCPVRARGNDGGLFNRRSLLHNLRTFSGRRKSGEFTAFRQSRLYSQGRRTVRTRGNAL